MSNYNKTEIQTLSNQTVKEIFDYSENQREEIEELARDVQRVVGNHPDYDKMFPNCSTEPFGNILCLNGHLYWIVYELFFRCTPYEDRTKKRADFYDGVAIENIVKEGEAKIKQIAYRVSLWENEAVDYILKNFPSVSDPFETYKYLLGNISQVIMELAKRARDCNYDPICHQLDLFDIA